MTALTARIRARLARLAGDDEGTTLAELVVGMGLMTVFMTIFTGATLMMTNTANKVQATTVSASQTNQAFLKLDKMVRYAGAVSTPGVGTGTGNWYVEMDSSSTGSDICTQLRIDKTKNQLQLRSWAAGGTPPSAFTPMADNIVNGSAVAGSADAPFTTPGAIGTASTTFQRLQIVLVATAGNGTTSTTRSQMTFTALNSDVSLSSNATTCQPTGARP